MIEQILSALVAWIVGIISSTGYLGIVVRL
jgi:hypothetical protein